MRRNKECADFSLMPPSLLKDILKTWYVFLIKTMRYSRLTGIWIRRRNFRLPLPLINRPKQSLSIPMLYEKLQVVSHLDCDEMTSTKNFNIAKSSCSSRLLAWLMEGCKCIAGQKLCGHLQLPVKTLKRNTNCAIIRNQLAKALQKARASNSLKLYLSYYMLEWPLEQQIAV